MLKRLLSELVTRKDVRARAYAPSDPPLAARGGTPQDASATASVAADGWQERLASGPMAGLTVLVPFLPGREPFLRAMLEHMEFMGMRVPMVMSVSYDGDSHGGLENLLRQFPRQSIDVSYHRGATSFFERLVLMAKRGRTPYVFVHSDDDFVVPQGLEQSVRFLDEHPDYVACQGRSAFMSVTQQRGLTVEAQLFLSLDQESPLDRLGLHCKSFTTTFHAVTRREAFVRAHEGTLANTANVIFLQYLASCWLVAIGKLGIVPVTHYLRYDNPRGERARLIKNRDKTHWPYLIVAPNFSDELMKFRSGLAAALAQQGVPADEGWLDECSLGLAKRAFGQFRAPSPEEILLTKELRTSGTDLNALVQRCSTLAVRALADMQSAR